MMLENPKQNEGIESGRDAREPETKQRDRIQARCWRTRNKTKGSNLSVMLENPKQNKGFKFDRDAGEPETKGSDEIRAQCRRTRNKRKDRKCLKAQRRGYALV